MIQTVEANEPYTLDRRPHAPPRQLIGESALRRKLHVACTVHGLSFPLHVGLPDPSERLKALSLADGWAEFYFCQENVGRKAWRVRLVGEIPENIPDDPAPYVRPTGAKDSAGRTQYQRVVRSNAIYKLARATLGPQSVVPVHFQDFTSTVRRFWPEVSSWAVSRICTTARVRDKIYKGGASVRVCKVCMKQITEKWARFCSEPCKTRWTNRNRRPVSTGPVRTDIHLLASDAAKSGDWLLNLAFELAVEISYKGSPELIGPIWEGMQERYGAGERSKDALRLAARESLRRHYRTLQDRYGTRSIDAMREAWNFEPTSKPQEIAEPEEGDEDSRSRYARSKVFQEDGYAPH